MTDGKPTGLLLAMTEPPAGLEEEFQDWYDTEHFPERAITEGFLTATRFVCIEGWPRYLALYDLSSVDVLHGPAYAKIAGTRYSPWTRRIIPKVWGQYRAEGVQRYPGSALFGAKGVCARVALWRFCQAPPSAENQILNGLQENYEHRAETAQVRLFAGQQAAGTDYLGIVELRGPVPPGEVKVAAFGSGAQYIDLVNFYVPYYRQNAGAFPQTT